MRLKLIRHLWGVDDAWEVCFTKFKSEGYAGIETPLIDAKEQDRFAALMKSHEFDYIAMAFTSGDSVAAHVKSFEQQFRRAIELGATQLTAHSGLDRWSLRESETYFKEVLDLERSNRLPVAHETHRGRILFNPWITQTLLDKFDALRLCCDFSHWVCVAEREFHDEHDLAIVKACAQRCLHIHARVGYPEGPQVPDPLAREYSNDVEAHDLYWKLVWQSQRARGMQFSTVTPEFGPPGYLHTLPHTNMPVADLAKVVESMTRHLKLSFANAEIQ